MGGKGLTEAVQPSASLGNASDCRPVKQVQVTNEHPRSGNVRPFFGHSACPPTPPTAEGLLFGLHQSRAHPKKAPPGELLSL